MSYPYTVTSRSHVSLQVPTLLGALREAQRRGSAQVHREGEYMLATEYGGEVVFGEALAARIAKLEAEALAAGNDDLADACADALMGGDSFAEVFEAMDEAGAQAAHDEMVLRHWSR